MDTNGSTENNPLFGTNMNFQSTNNEDCVMAGSGLDGDPGMDDSMSGQPKKKKETEKLKCDICNCTISSSAVMALHLNGAKHKKKLKALSGDTSKESNDVISQEILQMAITESSHPFRCEICLVSLNSAQQLQIHCAGVKHKKKAAKASYLDGDKKTGQNGIDGDGSPAAKKTKKEELKMIPCKICNIFSNSPIQHEQHLVSKRHVAKQKQLEERPKFRNGIFRFQASRGRPPLGRGRGFGVRPMRPFFNNAGPRTPFNAPRVPFNGPKAPFNAPRIPFTGPRTPFGGPRPLFNGPRNPFNAPPRPFFGNRFPNKN